MKSIFNFRVQARISCLSQVVFAGIMLGVCFTATAQFCVTAPSGIISWWAAENDASDNLNLNNGILVGSPTFSPGKVGMAFNFNGVNQFVRIPDSASLHFTTGMTLEAWVNPTAYRQATTAVITKSDSVGVNQHAWYLNIDGNGHPFVYTSTNGIDGQTAAQVAASATCPLGTWTHIAGTYNGTNLSIYVNGTLDKSVPLSGNLFPSTDDVGIGASIGGGQDSDAVTVFSGLIDEPAVYARALTASEISAIYAADISGKCGGSLRFTQFPASQTNYEGTSATFTVGVSGPPPITLQWQLNGANINSATNTSLVLTNLQFNQAGTYTIIASNPSTPDTISANASLYVLARPACVTAPAGLVSWWPGENDADDNNGKNSGILTGSPTFVAGKVGTAFSFNGTNQFVRIPDAPSLHLSNGMTLEAWVNPTAYKSSTTAVISKSDVNAVNQQAWYLALGTDGTPYIYTSTNGADGQIAAQISAVHICPLNVWTHIAATYDGNNLVIYVNGTAENSTPLTGNLFNSTDDVGIGANLGGGTGNQAVAIYAGLIDEPSIYNRALSPDEISAIYNAQISGKCPPPFAIISQPTNRTVRLGGQATFSVNAIGPQPITYQWYFNNTNLVGATNSSLVFSNSSVTQAGTYYVAVSSFGGSPVISSNATLNVVVALPLGNGQLLTNSQYTFTNTVTIQFTNYAASGYTFYTLDGTTPTAGSTFYTGAFQITNNCIIQARGYSSDFQQTSVSDPVAIVIIRQFTLTSTTPGGGRIIVTPASSSYMANTVVGVTATPSNGWTFLQWQGDLGGTNLSNNVVMNRNKSVQAIFGTKVTTATGGNGSIVLDPPGGNYPYGTLLQAAAIPQSGNVLVFWGGAASGSTNPLSFSVTNTNSTISALFNTLGGGQFALAVVPVGHGTVSCTPRASAYSNGQSVTITATPNTNKLFLGWSGSASGTNNPLTISMTQSKTIFANFTTNNSLVIYPAAGTTFTEGAVLDLNGEIGTHYRLDASSNLVTWTNLYDLTNAVGTIHYIDLNATNLNHRFYHATTLP